MITTGRKIISARKQIGLSAAEFARELDKNPSVICRWEKDMVLPTIESCYKIISVFSKYNLIFSVEHFRPAPKKI